jgi:broad specificity phosphatase PhoE
MQIYFIRHGEKTDNSRNHAALELTEKGLRQADVVGLRLKNHGIQRIYTSDMVRAVQTSEAVNRYFHVDIKIRHELREIHMGASEELGWAYLETYYPEFMTAYRHHDKDLPYPPDGESGADVWNRVGAVLQEIVESGLERVAVVTHGGVIRSVMCGILCIGQENRFQFAPPANCSITELHSDVSANRFRVVRYNDAAHLEES